METKDSTTNDKALDAALEFLENGEQMTDTQLEAMMRDKAIVSSVGDLLDMRKAAMASSPRAKIDVEGEWGKFMVKHPKQAPRRKSYTLFYYIAAAVVALTVVAGAMLYADIFGNKEPEGLLLRAENTITHPMLTSEKGKVVELDGKQDTEQLAALGVTTQGTREMKLTANAEETPDRLTLTIPRGQTYKLTLSDGSEVWMNNDCRLVYPNRFVGKERRVKIEGEAYFKIAPDASHPFIVEANGMEAKVLGTEFNVRSYDRSDVHVTLIKGSVEVTTAEKHNALLTPGQDAKLNDDGSLGIAEVDIESYLYWRDGYFYYDDIALENIMKDIGRWYNLNIVIENNEYRQLHLHFLADKRGGIDHVIKLINSMGKVKVERKDNTLIVK